MEGVESPRSRQWLRIEASAAISEALIDIDKYPMRSEFEAIGELQECLNSILSQPNALIKDECISFAALALRLAVIFHRKETREQY